MQFRLLPAGTKFLGLALMLPGLLFAWMFMVKNIKPDFLDLPVFAFYSSYTTKTVLGFTRTNLLDELAMLLILSSFILLIFSREKNEREEYNHLRAKSGFITLFIYAVVLALGSITFFGLGYLQFVAVSTLLPFIIYLLIFRFLILRGNKARQ